MEMVFHEEEAESSMVYENPHDASARDVALQSRSGEDSKVPAAVPGAEDVKKSSCRAAAVFLGLLCLLLLIGLITLVSRFTKSISEREMEMVLLHNSYNNLTKERDQSQTSYNNLTRQKDQLQTSYNNLTKEKKQLQTSYNNLVNERHQLENNLTRQKNQLQSSYNNLTKERDQLQTSYNNLTKEKKQLQTSYNNLVSERHQLENNLIRQKNQLQSSYNQLATEKDQLQERFEALTKDRNNLRRKLQDIEASFKNLTEERADLKRILNNFEWVYFGGSFYHISSLEKSWQKSRDDCLQKGADLIIINSKEEQTFTSQFKKYVWIGLTDSETEGTWKWVDGTPMTKSYWGPKEPNGGKGENCGEIKYYNAENSWNDGGCSNSHFWICEKKFLP